MTLAAMNPPAIWPTLLSVLPSPFAFESMTWKVFEASSFAVTRMVISLATRLPESLGYYVQVVESSRVHLQDFVWRLMPLVAQVDHQFRLVQLKRSQLRQPEVLPLDEASAKGLEAAPKALSQVITTLSMKSVSCVAIPS